MNGDRANNTWMALSDEACKTEQEYMLWIQYTPNVDDKHH